MGGKEHVWVQFVYAFVFFSLLVFCWILRIWKNMLYFLWQEIQKQFNCYWLAQKRTTDVHSMINVRSLFPTIKIEMLLLIIKLDMSVCLCSLTVMQEQNATSFVQSLQLNYGNNPDESKYLYVHLLEFHYCSNRIMQTLESVTIRSLWYLWLCMYFCT